MTAWRLNEDVRAETQEAYRQARESEERFKGAFENAPIGMVLVGLDPETLGRFIQVNRAMCEMAGRSEEELLTRTLPGHRPLRRRSRTTVELLEGLRTGEQRDRPGREPLRSCRRSCRDRRS